MQIEKFHEVVSKQMQGPFFCNAEALIGGRSCKGKLYGLATFAFEPATGPHHVPYPKLKAKTEKKEWPIEAGLKHLDEKVKLQVMHLFVNHMICNARKMLEEKKIIQDQDREIYAVVQLCRGSVEKNHCIPDLIQSLIESKTISFEPKDLNSIYRAEKIDDEKAKNTVALLKLTDLKGRVIILDIRNGWSEETFSEEAYKKADIVHNFTTCAIINPPCKETENNSCENCKAYSGKAVLGDRMVVLKQPKGESMKLMVSKGIETVDNYFKTQFDKIFTEKNIKATIAATEFFISKNPEKTNRDMAESDFVFDAMFVKGDGVFDIENPDHQKFVIA